MVKLATSQHLLIHNIKDLYRAESRLVKALPKMAKAATNPELTTAAEKLMSTASVDA